MLTQLSGIVQCANILLQKQHTLVYKWADLACMNIYITLCISRMPYTSCIHEEIKVAVKRNQKITLSLFLSGFWFEIDLI